MSETNNSNIEYAEADSQEEAAERLMQDLDEENGSWSPLFPGEVDAMYDPWIPQLDDPNDMEMLSRISFDTIGRYISQTSRRNIAERDISRQEHLNIQADFVEEVSQRLETERKANFLQRQVAILERQNLEDRRRIAEYEENEERQADLVLVIETRHQELIRQKDDQIAELQRHAEECLRSSLDAQERNDRQLEYLNQTEKRYWEEVSMMKDRVRELESRKPNAERLKRWANQRAKRNRQRKSVL